MGPVEEKVAVSVIGGLFTVSDLDFGANAFMGQARWLQVEVRCPPTIGSYTIVGDRQELTATPYALYAIAGEHAVARIDQRADRVCRWGGQRHHLHGGPGLTLTGGAFAANTAYLQRRVTGVCAAGSSIRVVNNDGTVTCETDDMGWSLTGNAGTTPGTHFLGTSDNQALEFKVNATRALRIEPNATSPNLIGGYSGNAVTAGRYGATIAGGGFTGTNCGAAENAPCGNQVSASFGTVSGGTANTASGSSATVGGGDDNTASNNNATVGGGACNTAPGWLATVGGGWTNTASNFASTVSGGSANTASGYASTVPGGLANNAGGDYSFAAGSSAKATHRGSFVWGDSTAADITSSANNQFKARASGGVVFYTNSGLTSGVTVGAGGNAWSAVSDRALKENFADVDGRALLDRLAQTPVTTWNYLSQDPSIRHIGPVAQDFYAAFGVGEDDTHISTIDADGVALAASQALYRLAQEQASQIAALQAQNAALESRLAALEAQMSAAPEPAREAER